MVRRMQSLHAIKGITSAMTGIIEHVSKLFTLPLTENVALFSVVLAVILIVPLLTQKLRIPNVIGHILCGVAMGPHALGIVDNAGAISLFSTIGILYIMFTAGLELDLNQFKLNRNRSFAFGFLTWAVPLAIIFPICYFGYDLGTLESFLVGSMFGTHTLIAYPAVSRMGVASDPCVAVSVGGTILADTGVLILLAVILGLASGNLSAAFWIELIASLAVFSVVMFFAVPRIAVWFFTHWHRENYLRYIFVLFMVFFSALMAEIAGLEGIVGAFLAGLVLNRLIPKNSQLMHRIEFVGNVLFIPIFLVTVGMLVNLDVIFDGARTAILAVVLSAGAIAGKFGAAWIAQKWFRYSKAQRNTMFGLSVARVATTLAIVLVAHRASIIDDSFLNASIVLILVTCIVASLITESATQSLALERSQAYANGTHEDEHAYANVLVPIANPDHAYDLFEFAEILHENHENSRVTMLSVILDSSAADTTIRAIRENIAKAFKDKLNPRKHQISTVIDHNLSDGIARAAREHTASALVLGWPVSGLSDIIIGEKWKAVIHDVDRLVVWCDLPMNAAKTKRLAVFTLPHAERECGFDGWNDMILKIAEHYTLKIVHIGTEEVSNAMCARRDFLQKSAPIEHVSTAPVDGKRLKELVTPEDWIVFISARQNTFCHMPICEKLPEYLSKHFKSQNKLLVYPSQPAACTEIDEFTVV